VFFFDCDVAISLGAIVMKNHIGPLFFGRVKRIRRLFTFGINDLLISKHPVELILLFLNSNLLFLEGPFQVDLVGLALFDHPCVLLALLLQLLPDHDLFFNLRLDLLLKQKIHQLVLVSFQTSLFGLHQQVVLLIAILPALDIGFFDLLRHLYMQLIAPLGALNSVFLCRINSHSEVLFDLFNFAPIFVSTHPDIVLVSFLDVLFVACVNLLSRSELLFFAKLGLLQVF
jgi:hypothetical protein